MDTKVAQLRNNENMQKKRLALSISILTIILISFTCIAYYIPNNSIAQTSSSNENLNPFIKILGDFGNDEGEFDGPGDTL